MSDVRRMCKCQMSYLIEERPPETHGSHKTEVTAMDKNVPPSAGRKDVPKGSKPFSKTLVFVKGVVTVRTRSWTLHQNVKVDHVQRPGCFLEAPSRAAQHGIWMFQVLALYAATSSYSRIICIPPSATLMTLHKSCSMDKSLSGGAPCTHLSK